MKIGFGIIVNNEVFNFTRESQIDLFQRFNTSYGLRQSPHITIKTPFETEDVEVFDSYLKKIAEKLTPFELCISGIGYFEPSVVYLAIKESKELRGLYEKINQDFQRDFEMDINEEMIFHLTLAYKDLTKQNFRNIKKYLKEKDPQFCFTVNTLGLFYFLPDEDSWILYKRYNA